jgi:hypothetical protein
MNADPFRPLPQRKEYEADLRVYVAANGAAMPVPFPKPVNEDNRNG